jgi:hypothetical protein
MYQHHQHTLKDALKDVIDELNWKEKLHQSKIQQVWKEKMGATINQYSKDLKFFKGKFFITIESASLKQELSYEREKIKEMLNREIGEVVVEDVIIR